MSNRDEWYELVIPTALRKDSGQEPSQSRWRPYLKYIIIVAVFLIVVAIATVTIVLIANRVDGSANTSTVPNVSSTVAKSTITTRAPPVCNKRIIGYYFATQTSVITRDQVSKLTHAVFAFVNMTSDGHLQIDGDLAKNRFTNLIEIAKQQTPQVKVMISIGGNDNSNNFKPGLSSPDRKKLFINSTVSFLQTYDIDGVDLYWKWPGKTSKDIYSQFINDLRYSLQRQKRNYIMSIVLPPPDMGANYEAGIDIENIFDNVDFLNIFTMGYFGPWQNDAGMITGAASQLFNGVNGVPGRKTYNIHHSTERYVCKTGQSDKYNIAIPFYTMLWKHVKGPVNPPNIEIYRNATFQGGVVGETSMSRKLVQEEGYDFSNPTYNPEIRAAFKYNATTETFLTFETNDTIAAKIDYVKDRILGGVWIWAVDMDDDSNNLLNLVKFTGYCTVGNLTLYNC
ncbi:GH18 domain-containing protein [Caenorhabditis elegans]|uniref:GH18 domain-containing protein n=1 Tax=Caenorhabditis elegans TaxID=6239 RepID=Q21862_CAEEL|nr:GH18 domain-containing protein [Caenorhabditis elegans]CAA93866.2 GH18 domain-containing protein [Caenorhabditis elegans]|eukprot:NP_496026.2 CHItinase-Like [Caenorhabditis elegans]